MLPYLENILKFSMTFSEGTSWFKMTVWLCPIIAHAAHPQKIKRPSSSEDSR
jgi:hypothetical protein